MIKFVKNIFNDLIFMIRFIFNDKKTIIKLLFMSLMPVLLPVILLPLNISFTMVVQFSLISCVTIVFGITTYNYRYSTLYKNTQTTSNNSWTFYISKYIFIVIISVIIATLLIGVLSFLNLFDLLMINFLGISGGDALYDFSYLPWPAYFIVIIELATVIFAISFLIKSLAKSSRTYYMFMFCLLILIIPFGSVLNLYFQPIVTVYIDDYFSNGDVQLHKYGMVFVSKENTTMARIFFIPSLIFPFYSTGVLFTTIGTHLMLDVNPYNFSSKMGFTDVFQWYSLVDLISSDVSNHILNNKIDSSNFLWQYKLVELMPLIDVIIFGIIGSIISKLKPNY